MLKNVFLLFYLNWTDSG